MGMSKGSFLDGMAVACQAAHACCPDSLMLCCWTLIVNDDIQQQQHVHSLYTGVQTMKSTMRVHSRRQGAQQAASTFELYTQSISKQQAEQQYHLQASSSAEQAAQTSSSDAYGRQQQFVTCMLRLPGSCSRLKQVNEKGSFQDGMAVACALSSATFLTCLDWPNDSNFAGFMH